MLRIRFSRTGKAGQPSYRIVVAEHRAPVKGRYIEMLGNYLPARKPEAITVNKDRINYWISKGAIPTDSVAALLKKEGLPNVDRYLEPRNKQRKPKGKKGEGAPAPAEAPKPAEAAAKPPTEIKS